MTDVIIPTWAEVNSWVVVAIAAIVFVLFVWIKGRREGDGTVAWIRDWNEPDIKEDW